MKNLFNLCLYLFKYLMGFVLLSLSVPYLFKSLPFLMLPFLLIVVILVMKRDLLGPQS